ncbi:MAG TPA: TPM domain-containing protein [Bacteroidales bacterium]|nr:TPM domain-containing protein [Bacteroidales bacterium]
MNRYKKILFLPVFIIFTITLSAQDIPERPVPPRLVNDYAAVLSPDEAVRLEQKLVSFNDSTSTQIVLVIVKSLNGYDENDYAQRLGQKWGVGQKGSNNGVVILVKPKYPNEKGEVSIQSGYGLEGVLPDITCKQIVENEMIPKFAQGDYYGGVSAGIAVVMSITKGEFTAGQYGKRARQQKPYGILVPIIILMIIVFWIRMSRGGTHSVGKSIPFWTSLFLLGSMGRGGSGSWGNFQSGGGDGGGGFGGFGGGGFGGGGAGGSW